MTGKKLKIMLQNQSSLKLPHLRLIPQYTRSKNIWAQVLRCCVKHKHGRLGSLSEYISIKFNKWQEIKSLCSKWQPWSYSIPIIQKIVYFQRNFTIILYNFWSIIYIIIRTSSVQSTNIFVRFVKLYVQEASKLEFCFAVPSSSMACWCF